MYILNSSSPVYWCIKLDHRFTHCEVMGKKMKTGTPYRQGSESANNFFLRRHSGIWMEVPESGDSALSCCINQMSVSIGQKGYFPCQIRPRLGILDQ